MSGIVAYIESKPAKEIVIKGLKLLEYRGYNYAGMALKNGENFITFDAVPIVE